MADLKVCSYEASLLDAAGAAAVRLRSGEDLGAMKIPELISRLRGEVEERR